MAILTLGKPAEETPPEGLLERVEHGIENIKTRPFDLYVLGPFLIWYGLRSKKMPRMARRILVTSGIFKTWYAWRSYRELPQTILTKLQEPNNGNQATI